MCWHVCLRFLILVRKIWWIIFFVWSHSFSLITDCVQKKLVFWIVFWFQRRSLVLLYTWHQIFSVEISEHLYGFCCVYHIPFRPLNIPCHDEPLGISIVKIVRISRVVICIPNHNVLVILIWNFFINNFPFSDVCDTSKLWERTNNLRFLSINNFKRALRTEFSCHTVLYELSHMNCLCLQHFLICVIQFCVYKHS